jgi:hypothetical protein
MPAKLGCAFWLASHRAGFLARCAGSRGLQADLGHGMNDATASHWSWRPPRPCNRPYSSHSGTQYHSIRCPARPYPGSRAWRPKRTFGLTANQTQVSNLGLLLAPLVLPGLRGPRDYPDHLDHPDRLDGPALHYCPLLLVLVALESPRIVRATHHQSRP